MTYAYQLNDVHFFYGQTLALSLSELSVESGKTTALIGPNGCGKSTLLNLLTFLERPSRGRICFFNTDSTQTRHLDYRRRIGFLPQKPYMLNGTVQDNLMLALKFHNIPKYERDHRVMQMLKQLDISHLKNQMAKTLSGGELQKSALARAMITRPEVLLLDEPFSYLDQASIQSLERFIDDYGRQIKSTLIFSTHNRLQGLALADNVISMVNGKQVETPLINVYNGHCENHIFNTGKLAITLTGEIKQCSHISIDPHEIVLSRAPFISSIRNQYQGRIVTISDEMGKVRVAVAAGEVFQTLITFEALKELNLNLGEPIWVSFKSNSITTF